VFFFISRYVRFLLHCLLSVRWVGKLFCRFWFVCWLVRPANVLDYCVGLL
jgi:hypothetical protein